MKWKNLLLFYRNSKAKKNATLDVAATHLESEDVYL